MARPVLPLALGAIVGSIGTCLLLMQTGLPGVDRSVVHAGTAVETRSAVDPIAGAPAAETDSATLAEEFGAAGPASRLEPDSAGALRDAVTIGDPGERRRAVLQAGRAWARTDPLEALAQAATLPSALQADYRASVTAEWANLDAEAFFVHAENAAKPEELTGGLKLLIASDPARVFEIALRLPYDTGIATNSVQIDAMRALADRDPVAAMQRLVSFPRGRAYEQMLPTVVTRYARIDPDAALAWLDSLDAYSSNERRAVITGIAFVDFDRAYETAEKEATTGLSLDWSLASAMVMDPGQTAVVADKLLGLGTSRADQMLAQLAESWVARDPDAVVDWMIEHSDRVDAPLARAIGLRLATRDVASALGYLGRLPPGLQATWVVQLAGSYAEEDPTAALDWIAQYRGQAFYEDARSQVVMAMADSRPELVAAMFPSLSPALRAAAAPRVARVQAEQDPLAAAAWVLDPGGGAADSSAVNAVVSAWAASDAEAARVWVVGLPRGEMRDGALARLISTSEGTGVDPRPIIDEIESDAVRRSVVRRAVSTAAATNPELAKELVATLVDDPELGQWARDALVILNSE